MAEMQNLQMSVSEPLAQATKIAPHCHLGHGSIPMRPQGFGSGLRFPSSPHGFQGRAPASSPKRAWRRTRVFLGLGEPRGRLLRPLYRGPNVRNESWIKDKPADCIPRWWISTVGPNSTEFPSYIKPLKEEEVASSKPGFEVISRIDRFG